MGSVTCFLRGGGRGSGLGGAKGFPCLDGTAGGTFGLWLKRGLDPGEGCLVGCSDGGSPRVLVPLGNLLPPVLPM